MRICADPNRVAVALGQIGEAVPVADKRVLAFKTGKGMHARLNASEAPVPAEAEATAERLLRRA